MILEVAVRDGNVSGTLDDVYKAISAVGEITMVHPDVVWSKDGNGISVGFASAAIVRWRTSHCRRACWLTIVDVNVVNNDVAHELHH